MRRRDLATALAYALAGSPRAFAQESGRGWANRIVRIGALMSSTGRADASFISFERVLAEAGFVDGQNLAILLRVSNGRADLTQAMAVELVEWRPDVLVAGTSPPTEALLKLTRSIPIVSVAVSDPLRSGFIESFSRPGGNVTGIANNLRDVAVKQAEILLDLVPGAEHVGYVYNTTVPAAQWMSDGITDFYIRKGRTAIPLPVARPEDYDTVFRRAVAGPKLDAAIVVADGMALAGRSRIADEALRARIPIVGTFREEVAAGALAAYGTDLPALFGRAATYVARILRGEQPATMPMELPSRYNFYLNERTATVLNVPIAPATLARADEVLE